MRLQAVGRQLLYQLRGASSSRGAADFLVCRQLHGGADFAVLTQDALMRISCPALRSTPLLVWSTPLHDIVHICKCAPCSAAAFLQLRRGRTLIIVKINF